MKIRVSMTGRAYHDNDSLPPALELPPRATLGVALEKIKTCLQESDSALSNSCLVAVSGTHAGTVGNYGEVLLKEGDEITLIAPVAGG